MPTANEISMLQAARTAGITSRDELANLMAQIGVESGGLTQLEESFRYTRGVAQISINVPSVLREGRETAEAARLEALDGRPQELARLMYGGRMGNDDAGDGYRYRGRGFIQLTGENNYRATGAALDLDLIGHPELAANRDNASRIALSFWQNNVPQAARDDVSAATRAINGGAAGLADRHNRFDAWYAQLTPEFMADLAAERVQPGNGVGPAIGQEAMADGALRRFETGTDVRQLRSDLHTLGVRYDRNHVVIEGNTYDANVEQGVRRFQEEQGLPVTGRASQDTLEAIQDALQRQRPQQGNPAAPRMGAPGGANRPEEQQDNPLQGPQRNDQAQTFSSDHRDYALFEAIRRQLPEGTTEEKAAEVAIRTKTMGGILCPDQIDKVIVQDDRVFVMGKIPGFRIDANLSTPAPSLQETLQRTEAFDRQQMQQLSQFQEQQRFINHDQNAPGMGARSLG